MQIEDHNRKVMTFIENYMQTGNRRQAFAAAVGHDNFTRATLYSFWRSPAVRAMVAQIDAEALRLASIDKAWVLRRAALIADFDIQAFIRVDEKDGQPYYDFRNATDDDWYCISEIVRDVSVVAVGKQKPIEVTKVKIKAESKMQALKLIAEHADVAALAPIKVELSGEDFAALRTRMLEQDDV